MSDEGERNEVRRMQSVYSSMWAMEFAFADEIAEENRKHVLLLAARSKDPEDRRLLLRLAELELVGARDHWRIDAAHREGTLAALVAQIQREQPEPSAEGA